MTESRPAAVGLGIDVELSPLCHYADGAHRQVQLPRCDSQFHRALVQRPDASMLDAQESRRLERNLELSARRMRFELEAELAGGSVELVITDAEFFG